MKNFIILASLIALTASWLTGCQQTVSGFGKDMQSNGKAIQKTIEK